MIAWARGEIGKAPALYASLCLVAVTFGVYANTLEAGFHFDDSHHIVSNPYLRDARYATQYFHRPDMFSALVGHDMYRPLVLLSFHLNYKLGGYDPFCWRLTAIALHALSVVGVFLTIRVLAQRRRASTVGALVAALFFAVHPVFTETVDYASARSSLLATLFTVWAFLLHRRAAEARNKPKRVALWTLSLLLFGAALLAKEIAIVFPALLVADAVLQRRHQAAVLPSIVVAGLYLYVRQMLLGAAVVDFGAREAALATADPGSGGARTVLANLYTQARVVASYLALFALPVGLCLHRFVRVSLTPLEPGLIGGVLLIATVLVVAWRCRRKHPLASLGLVWFLVALAPTSSLIPLNQVMNEHRLYLPGVGLALALGAVARPRWLVAAAVLAALTVARNRDWNDPVRIWESAVEVSPQSAGAWNSLGVQRRVKGDYKGAIAAFEQCLERKPRSWEATFNLGTLHLQRGRDSGDYDDLEAAERWLESSLDVRESHRSRWYLAETYHAMGRIERAENAFRRLASLDPRLYEMTRYPLAKIAIQRGRLDVAQGLYRQALVEGHDPVAAHLGLASLALERNDRAAALAAAGKALEVRPHDPRPHLFLARLHAGTAVGVRHLMEAERRGFKPTEQERRSILERRSE